ncbi:MAG: hypothetical protein KC766_03035 [Myxococcales bacterium]|nr:hypothetical protein [Myxococcales bacterium]
MGRTRWAKVAGVGFAAAMALGCSPRAKPIKEVPDLLPDAAPPPAAPSATTAPVEEPPEVAEIERAAKALENCRPEPVGDYENCTEWAEWHRRETAWFEDKDRDELVIGLLGSEHAAVRYAAAEALSLCKRFQTDKALATKLMTALEKEKDPQVGPSLVRAIQVLDYESVGLLKRAHAVVKAHPNKELRLALIREAGLIPGTAPILLELFDGADEELKRAIVQGVFLGEEKSACAVYEKALKSGDDRMSDMTVAAIATTNRCQDLLAPVIGWLGKLKEPPTDSNIGENIGNLCAWPGNPRQHAQLLAQAKRLAMKGRTEIRSGALKSVMRCDAKLGPGFVRAFTKDKDPKVADAARQLLAEPPGQAHMDVL